MIECDRKLLVPFREIHPGQAVDQIDRPGSEACICDRFDALQRLIGSMRAAHEAQAILTEALCAKAQPVDTDRLPCSELLRGDVIRIGFQGDLDIFGNFEKSSRLIDVSGDPFDRDHAWRSATEIDRTDIPIGEFRNALIQLRSDRIENTIHSGGICAEMEVAVGAGLSAEGDMEVEAWHKLRSITIQSVFQDAGWYGIHA